MDFNQTWHMHRSEIWRVVTRIIPQWYIYNQYLKFDFFSPKSSGSKNSHHRYRSSLSSWTMTLCSWGVVLHLCPNKTLLGGSRSNYFLNGHEIVILSFYHKFKIISRSSSIGYIDTYMYLYIIWNVHVSTLL